MWFAVTGATRSTVIEIRAISPTRGTITGDEYIPPNYDVPYSTQLFFDLGTEPPDP